MSRDLQLSHLVENEEREPLNTQTNPVLSELAEVRQQKLKARTRAIHGFEQSAVTGDHVATCGGWWLVGQLEKATIMFAWPCSTELKCVCVCGSRSSEVQGNTAVDRGFAEGRMELLIC